MLFFGYLIIPFLTICFASQASLINENFTGIANHQNQKYLLALWTLMVAFYFLKASLKLFNKCRWQPKFLKPVSAIIFFGSCFSPWIPYQEQYPLLESLHVFMAMGASILFMILLGRFITELRVLDLSLFHKIEPPFRFIISTLIILFIWSGHVNSLTEAFMASALSIYLSFALDHCNSL